MRAWVSIRTSSGWLIVLLCGRALLCGQNPPAADEPIATDRPSVANSSVVVPQGSLQVENGLLLTSSAGQRSLDGPETALRFGVASATELRFSVLD